MQNVQAQRIQNRRVHECRSVAWASVGVALLDQREGRLSRWRYTAAHALVAECTVATMPHAGGRRREAFRRSVTAMH